ncbi:unnamed protein product [Chrysodeixis includens]|uniref:Sperm microtubule inner protein 1 C-terminal domain-containing protein n=1 Tax=Chrysodeixis includens TaxID=689277 RepID=A0A9N8KW79_CHRIL|nr:unnamed protein product [Chrysodeixis includens]
MSTVRVSDPAKIAFLSENYEKEKWLRMQWSEKYMAYMKRATVMNREPTNYTEADIKSALITACMPSLSRCTAESAVNKKTVRIKDDCLVKIDDSITTETEPSMKAITDEERAILYKSKNAYLKLRHKLPPHEKYNYIECESWVHGWNIEQSEIKLRGPVHGNIYHLRRMKGIGPQPDPKYYQETTDVHTICKEI